jgi:hypothetical protein
MEPVRVEEPSWSGRRGLSPSPGAFSPVRVYLDRAEIRRDFASPNGDSEYERARRVLGSFVPPEELTISTGMLQHSNVRVPAGRSIVVGDYLVSDENGNIIPATEADAIIGDQPVIGVALEAGATGETISIQLNPGQSIPVRVGVRSEDFNLDRVTNDSVDAIRYLMQPTPAQRRAFRSPIAEQTREEIASQLQAQFGPDIDLSPGSTFGQEVEAYIERGSQMSRLAEQVYESSFPDPGPPPTLWQSIHFRGNGTTPLPVVTDEFPRSGMRGPTEDIAHYIIRENARLAGDPYPEEMARSRWPGRVRSILSARPIETGEVIDASYEIKEEEKFQPGRRRIRLE